MRTKENSLKHMEMAQGKIEYLWAKGTDFPKDEVQEAMKDNKMLLLDMDFTGECDLHCFYCDRTPDRFDKGSRVELTTEERKDLILQAKSLGARTIEFPGAGEPMIDKGFWEVIEFIHENGMTPIVFTSGWHLNDDSIKRLYDLGATIFLKYNSSDPEIQDNIVKVKGYGVHVRKVLYKLVDIGFTKEIPTRLAIDMVVTPKSDDMEDVENIYRWCRQNNVHNYISTLIPEGLADRKSKLYQKKIAVEFNERLRKIDREEFGLDYKISLPMVGGYKCRQVNVGLFVNLFGEVYDCNGLGRYLGHIRENSLEEIWNAKYAKSVRSDKQDGFCLVRERVWGDTELKGWDRKSKDYEYWAEKNGKDEIVEKAIVLREYQKKSK
ncbi:radical SAM protein [Bacillus sp. A301a_S52]|jgi:MoaA/NifB/PqqE/SkfB family radical SAM enzyme|nr:radical SAM protein [Bacillus sp. A301a_S52]